MIPLPAIPWLKLLKAAPWLLLALALIGLQITRSTLATARAEHKAFIAEVERQTAQARADDMAHARAVEAAQAKTATEVSSAYQNDLAALRARYDRLRASAAQGGGGGKSLPVAAEVPSGSDAASACEDPQLMFDAQADALQLTAIQNLIREYGMAE